MKNKKTRPQQRQNPVEALNGLMKTYKALIAEDSILKEDIDLLKRNLETQPSCLDLQCKYILVHLRAEIQESLEDDLRLGDEAMFNKDEKALARDKQYLLFKSDIDRFYANYIIPDAHHVM
tara:strand:+ start:1072 stop:1434 length:363 start_codon:yes stop_codon:yes gene_type:complete